MVDLIQGFVDARLTADPKVLDPDAESAAIAAIDQAYHTVVADASFGHTQTFETNKITFARQRLGVDETLGLEAIEHQYRKIMGVLDQFEQLISLPCGGGLLAPLYELQNFHYAQTIAAYSPEIREQIAGRMQRIRHQFHSMYLVAYHSVRLQKVGEPTFQPPLSQLLSEVPKLDNHPEEVPQTDNQKLLSFALFLLMQRGAKRFGGYVMVPKRTVTGHSTTAYVRLCEIKEFPGQYITKHAHEAIWGTLTGGQRVEQNLINVLERYRLPEFPDLLRCRSRWAFRNGIYDGKTRTFTPYDHSKTTVYCKYQRVNEIDHETAEILAETNPSDQDFAENLDAPSAASRPSVARQADVDRQKMAACHFIDLALDPTDATRGSAEIATPVLDKIFNDQNLLPRVQHRVMALLGRMFYEVGELDDWQVMLFIKGLAGTGKSTLLKLLEKCYAPEDVGVVSNNMEAKFGIAPLADKFILICMEMRSDFAMAQSDLQSIISGECLTIAEKFKNAKNNQKWKAPMASAGNMVPTWNRDGSGQGAMERRLVIAEFGEQPTKMDSTLFSRLCAELPTFIVKANMAYHEMLDEVGVLQLWDQPRDAPHPLPDYFHKQKAKLAEGLNSLESFLKHGAVMTCKGDEEEMEKKRNSPEGVTAEEEEDHAERQYRVLWSTFLQLYKYYCVRSNSNHLNLTLPDNYDSLFKRYKLTKKRQKLLDPVEMDMKDDEWVLGCRIKESQLAKLAIKK